jgi:hypothetical protein
MQVLHSQQARTVRKISIQTIEAIFVGYGSNSHAYRVYNKSNGCVVETCDVVFDEFNGSHGEQVDLSDVGDEDSSQDILNMGVGALLPMEQEPHDGVEDDACLPIYPTITTPTPPQDPTVQPQEQDPHHVQQVHHQE